jgi:hypothetical protein
VRTFRSLSAGVRRLPNAHSMMPLIARSLDDSKERV